MQSEKGGQQDGRIEMARKDKILDRLNLGERIKAARLKAGFTQRALAKRLDVSAGAVGQWETGGVPATERLANIADHLAVSLDWLLGKSPNQADRLGKQAEEDLRLLDEARQLGVDLRTVVAEARQQRWLEDNRAALADANAFLDRHGLWSDGKRQF
jgi:transcriptional regulator with XRE-family HTH domain